MAKFGRILTMVLCALPLLGAARLSLGRQPVAVLVPSLDYPVVALRAGVGGLVVVECHLTSEGRVERVKPVSGPPVLIRSVLESAREWQFSVDGLTPEELRVRLSFEFKVKSPAVDGSSHSQFYFVHPHKALISAPRPYAAVY
jgi:TonB family protein